MRILQLLNRVPWPLHDGGSIGYYNVIKGYADAGHEVTVLAMNTTKHRVTQLPSELTNIAKWITVDIDNRVKPLDALLNLFGTKSYNVQRFVSEQYDQQLQSLLKQQQFDVVVFESLFVMPYYQTVATHSSALTVLRQYNVEHQIWKTLANNTGNPIKKWYLNLLAKRLKTFEQQAIQQADCLTTVTADDKQDLIQLGCTKPIHISPIAVSIPEQAANRPQASVFHIGSMEWIPNKEGIRWLINEVWPKVLAVSPTTQLHLAGRGIHKSFQSIPEQNIVVDGEVADANQYMNQHAIMVVPVFSGSGIRVKILEGMAAGKAIISTTLGAQGILYTASQNLLIADTAQEFAQAIIQLIQSPNKVETLGKSGRYLIERQYSYSKLIGEVIDFYRIQIQNKLKDV